MEIIWRLLVVIVLVATGAVGLGYHGLMAATQIGELVPTPLEAFAARPSATTVWSRGIGQLDNAASRATVTAVVLEDLTGTPRIMRGLRIDLTHLLPNPDCNLRFQSHAILCARVNAAISFAEDELDRVRAGVERGNAEGSLIISFRKRSRETQATGLIIGGYTFDDRQPPELISLIERGISELKAAPR